MPFLRLHFLWLLLGTPVVCWAQERSRQSRQYVILSDSLGPLHQIKAQRGGRQFEGILIAGPDQGKIATITIPKTSVEIFNLLVSAARVRSCASKQKENKTVSYFSNADTLLITMALLPNVTGEVFWLPIHLDTIPTGHLRNITDIVQEASERIATYRQAGNPGTRTLLCRDDLVPLMWRQGQYWAPSSYVLTEYFQIRQRPTQAFSVTDLATINIQSRPFPKEALLQEKRRQSGNPHAQLEAIPAGNILQRRDKNHYEFWSNPSVVLSHPDILHCGSEDFYYQPGIGIVSSTYKCYFQNALDKYTQYVLDEPFELVSVDGKAAK